MPLRHGIAMEIRQLRYLVEVATAGSISRAAEQLCIAQSAVSRQIADLEAELGVVLLRRQRAGGVLTDAGLRFVDGARDILALLETLRHSVTATAAEPQRLRIGLPPTVSPILVTLMAHELPAADLPLRPTVVEGSSHWLAHRLDSADLDCAVLTNPEASRTRHVETLWAEALFLVGSTSAPWAREPRMALRDVAALPLTLTPRGDASREAIEAAFAAEGLTARVVQEHEAVTLLRELMATGATCSILSQTVARTLTRGQPLAVVPIPGLSIRRGLAVRRGALPRHLIERLAERIRATAHRHFAASASDAAADQ